MTSTYISSLAAECHITDRPKARHPIIPAPDTEGHVLNVLVPLLAGDGRGMCSHFPFRASFTAVMVPSYLAILSVVRSLEHASSAPSRDARVTLSFLRLCRSVLGPRWWTSEIVRPGNKLPERSYQLGSPAYGFVLSRTRRLSNHTYSASLTYFDVH